MLATGQALVGPESGQEVRVFPNPFVRQLRYTYCGTARTEAYLYDGQGHLIQRLILEPGEGTWEIAEDLPQGLYFLQVGETGMLVPLSKQ
ncbi:MAG: T9SS type A sorting domain-containing protein [Bacteroidia bacterium]|nr:T9SS type A sorting domain-containing protein [Bacteroidia bacterium]